MVDWLAISREIGREVRCRVREHAGRATGRRVVGGLGAGGDETIYLDALAEEALFERLKSLRGEGEKFRVLSEESGFVDFGAEYPVLVVDPVDGSMNAKMGLPMYAFSIAVCDGPTLADAGFGYVLNLDNGEEFHATKGSGEAYHNGQLIGPAKKHDRVEIFWLELSDDMGDVERLYPMFRHVNKVRVGGVMALGICYTATGAVDLFYHMKRGRVLDFAAAKIVLEEAGGRMTDEKGGSLDGLPIDLERHVPLVASRCEDFSKYVYMCFEG